MAQDWSSQSDDDAADDTGSWIVRRNAQLALQAEADKVGRDLWNQATRDGNGLYAGNPSDLRAIGLATLGNPESYSPVTADEDERGVDPVYGFAGAPGRPSTEGGSPVPRAQDRSPSPPRSSEIDVPTVSELNVLGRRPVQAPHPGLLDDLDHNPAVRAAAGGLGFVGGLFVGVPRTGVHAIEGIGEAARFAGGLFNPQGRADAWNGTKAAANSTLQYLGSRLAHPSRLGSDIAAQGAAAVHSVIPFTTPMGDNVLGEMKHEFGIGANAGEALTNVVGLASGFELAQSLNAIRGFEAAQPARIAKYMAQGFDEPTAIHLSKPYKGMGDHGPVPRRQDSILGFKAPALKKVPIPDWVMDSPFNVSKPRGMSQGDFYEYHYRVDPRFYGARLPKDLNGGKGWSGKRLELERYDGPGRIWARTPSLYKDAAAAMSYDGSLRQRRQDDPGSPR